LSISASGSDLHTRLREAAVSYARAGWPILPVETPGADRLICGLCPEDAATADDWWSDEPYGIACYTGVIFDAVQMPKRLGKLVLPMLAQHGQPAVIEVPITGSWLFLVPPDAPRIADLPGNSGVRLIGRGRWILLPPTPVIGGEVSWIGQSGPNSRLPHSMNVQWAAHRALVIARRRPSPARR
jgi:Bifunctional DNA primase/polymerase, N-terminal